MMGLMVMLCWFWFVVLWVMVMMICLLIVFFSSVYRLVGFISLWLLMVRMKLFFFMFRFGIVSGECRLGLRWLLV